ncbi:MAG TPA: iron uptake system protein EfeO [Pseudonocardiaceae bacterium]|nr:iron uptake system protein EfeO [Pseudonocardiaceae bacterium]
MAIVAAAACTPTSSANNSPAGHIMVKAGEKTCEVSATALNSGRHTFTIENTADRVSEVYIYGAGDQVISEAENVKPAATRDLIVDLPAGKYQVACKPGMVGSGIRTALTVSGPSIAAGPADARLQASVASYRSYVETEAQALVDTTAAFTAAVRAGNIDQAKSLYPAARTHYERIEPIAEAFGDLDPLIDMRADDANATTPFVGFHKLEQDLWESKNISGSGPTADALDANVKKLQSQIPTLEITPITMGNGAKELLDEVAKSKVTGEEERYSHIDLVDFEANVDGSRAAYTSLRPVLAQRDPALVSTLDTRFDTLLGLLSTHFSHTGDAGDIPGSPFVSYTALNPAQIKALSDEVINISEPLGQISGELTAK